MESDFELLGELTDIEIIAVNLSIRERRRLKERFGGRRWRKLKGVGLCVFLTARPVWPSYTDMKPTALAGGR